MVSRRVTLVVILALAILIGAVLVLSFKFLTGGQSLKDLVSQQLEAGLGRTVDVRDVKFLVFPSPRLELSDLRVHEPHSDQVLVEAKRVTLVVRLFPLLRQRLVGKRLQIEEPTVTLRRNVGGQWNVLAATGAGESQGWPTEAGGGLFTIQEVILTNGTLTVIDEVGTGGSRSITFDHVEATFLLHPDREIADLRVATGQSEAPGSLALSLNGTVSLTEERAPLDDENSPSPLPPVQFDGQLDVVLLDVKALTDFLGFFPMPTSPEGTASLHSTVQIRPGVVGYDLLLSDLSAKVNEVTLTGKASLSGLLTGQPAFSLTFSSSMVSLSQVMQVVPAGWIDPGLPAVLAERHIQGNVQVVNATLTGAAAEGARLSLTGVFHVQDAQGLIGRDRVLAKDIACDLVVEPGRIRATSVRGTYGAMHLSDGKAMLSFLEAGPWLEVEVSGKTSAAQLIEVFTQTVRVELLSRVLADAREIEGSVEQTFRLAGFLEQGDGLSFVGGEIVAHAVGLTHPSLPDRVTGLNGRFVLSSREVRLERVRGHLGETLVEVQGTMTAGESGALQDVLIEASGPAAELVHALAGKSPGDAVEGRLVARAKLFGAATAPHLRGVVVFDQAKVMVPWLGEKPVGAPATIEFEGDITQAGGLLLSQLDLIAPSLHVPARGRLMIGDSFSADMSIATGTVSLSRLPEWIAKGGLEAGNAEISLDIKGKGTDWSSWRVTGWVALTNGLATVSGMGGGGRVQDLYARVKLVRNGAEIKRLSFKVLDSDIALEALVKNWSTKPVITGKIESNRLDLSLLVPRGERSPLREFFENLAATTQATLSATVADGRYEHLALGALSARLTVQDGLIDIDRISSDSRIGQIAGRLVAQLPQKSPAEVEVSFRATGFPVEAVLRLTDPEDAHGVSGVARVSGSLRGHGRNPHGIAPSLNGKIEILLQDGRILKSNERIIWKILSLLNLPAVLQGKVDLEKEGLPYNTITATVTVTNGLVETDNLIVSSPILKITGAGRYDAPTDHLDFVTAVSPFGSYSQFLQTIPLFGRIFAGERKGVATAIFAVKGPLRRPDVTYLPVKSFASGLSGLAQLAVDVLVNSLSMPLDLMAPDQEESRPESERASKQANS
ncbi:MAG: AsmA-like C-terminal domain-containing protein [Nitrospira sp.]|nr:AsmA-like C-terminal domain-containing protein [Nitrospira sp.]